MEQQQSYYMVIPAPVWNAEITAKAMILYGHVSVLAKKEGYCFANNKYFEKVMKMSSSTVQRCFVELESSGLIRRELIYKEGSKEVDTRKIYIFEHSSIIKPDHRPIITEDNRSVVSDDQDNSTSNNNINTNNILDVPSTINGTINKEEEAKAKIFFKLVDMYPKNKVGNRQHGLKAFKKLDIKEAMTAIKNVDRYLRTVNEPKFVKSLLNYLDQECWSEEYLNLEETKNRPKNITNTKTFKATYDDID
jgi:hypothetical protein